MANSNIDQPIHVALEVVRLGHDDLADPDLAHVAQAIEQDPRLGERFARIEHTDEQLAQAFHDVPVPTGLADRLIDGLVAEGLLADEAIVASNQPSSSQLPAPSRRFAASRLFWASSIAVAASIVVAIFLLPPTAAEDLTTAEELLDQSITFFHNDASFQGTPVADQSPPTEFAASGDVRHVATARWREVDDYLGAPAVAYDLVGPRGEEATLYVAHRRLKDLEHVTMPSADPWLSTGGVSATCWQNDDLLYVLVVQGSREQYDAFIRQPGSTVAIHLPAVIRIAQPA
jgi:hypothetical protein